MSEILKHPSSSEQQEQKEKIDLSRVVIGIRAFRIGKFDPKSLGQFNQQVEAVKLFAEYLEEHFAEKSPRVVIITNSDLPDAGRQILAESDLAVVRAEQKKAERMAHLGRVLIGENSIAKGRFSYADMLNALGEEIGPIETESIIFASSDLANGPEVLTRQIVAMKVLYDQWEKERPGQLAMVGSLLEGVHDPILVQRAVEGTANITLGNLSKVFPNNALSLVRPQTKFSRMADNGLAGPIEVNGEVVPMGGNEDFLFGFKQMLLGRDCCLLIDPFVAGERQGEVSGMDAKYFRRQMVYRLYAKRLIGRAIEQGRILESGAGLAGIQTKLIIERMVDEHLFFGRVDQNNQPRIELTAMQAIKSVKLPI